MQVAAAIPRIARFGPEYEVLVLSGIYREAELILNIANEALHPLLCCRCSGWCLVAGSFALVLLA
jgi:hypothetical protein